MIFTVRTREEETTGIGYEKTCLPFCVSLAFFLGRGADRFKEPFVGEALDPVAPPVPVLTSACNEEDVRGAVLFLLSSSPRSSM